MFHKSLSALLISAACQAAPTMLNELEQVVTTSHGELTILLTLESEFYYDDSVGDVQRLI